MTSLKNEYETPTQEIIDLYDEYIVIDESYISSRAKDILTY